MLFACGGQQPIVGTPVARPASVPANAVHIAFVAGELTVNDESVEGFTNTDLTNGLHEPLIVKLPASGAAWITAPGDVEWLYVRKLFLSAREAGLTDIWLGLHGAEDAFAQPDRTRASFNNTCKGGPLSISGVDTSLSISIQTGSDGTWAKGTARFRPIAERDGKELPIVDLPPECWGPTTCSMFEERTASACESAITLAPLAAKVPVGGAVGCLLPIIKERSDAAEWRGQLAEVLETLAISKQTETLLMVEAKAPWESVTSIFGAFSDRKIRIPAVGTPLLEGHEGPPVCDAPIRDATGLQEARGIWLGSQLYRE